MRIFWSLPMMLLSCRTECSYCLSDDEQRESHPRPRCGFPHWAVFATTGSLAWNFFCGGSVILLSRLWFSQPFCFLAKGLVLRDECARGRQEMNKCSLMTDLTLLHIFLLYIKKISSHQHGAECDGSHSRRFAPLLLFLIFPGGTFKRD